MLKQMPGLRKLQRDAITGKWNHQLLAEMEDLGLIESPMLHQVTGRMDDTVALEGSGTFDRLLQHGVNVTNYVSFLHPVNVFVQRAAALGSTQKLCDLLLSGKSLSKRRLLDLGMTQEQWARVAKAQRVIKEESGWGGHTVKSLNLDGWEDQQAAAMLINGIRRWSGKVAQTSDIGSLSAWMSSDLGSVLMQFRKFTVAAWEKQFLHRVDMHDWNAAVTASASSLVAGLVYMAQSQINAQGRADKDEWLKERMKLENIAAMAFSRGGWSSLMPSIIDTGDYLTGGSGNTFKFGRSTGLDSMFSVQSVPVGNLVASAAKAAAGAGKSVRGAAGLGEENPYSQQDFAQAVKLLPFRRVLGISNALQAIEGTFPEEIK
jgi:hypothetical protein